MTIVDQLEAIRPLLVGWLTRKGADDPENIVQECWLRCWLAEQRGQTICKAFAWRIATNLLLDQLRREKFHEWTPIEDLNLTTPDPTEDLPDPAYVARLLRTLTEKQRQVVELRFLQGLNVAETARALGKTEAAVKKLQARGLVQAGMAA